MQSFVLNFETLNNDMVYVTQSFMRINVKWICFCDALKRRTIAFSLESGAEYVWQSIWYRTHRNVEIDCDMNEALASKCFSSGVSDWRTIRTWNYIRSWGMIVFGNSRKKKENKNYHKHENTIHVYCATCNMLRFPFSLRSFRHIEWFLTPSSCARQAKVERTFLRTEIVACFLYE